MTDVIEPASQQVWGASGTIVTADGVQSRAPVNADQWAAVQRSALVVAEAGNLLMISPRAKDTGSWMSMSRAMIEKSEGAIRAARDHDERRLFDAGGELYETCLNCHQQY